MKKCVVFVSVVLLLCLGAVGLTAQVNPTGSISGTVTDPSGAVVPGAAVVVTEIATQRVYNTQSDASGRFVLSNLSPGNYDVLVTHAGFQAGAYRALQIVVGQTYTLAAKLNVGQAGQTVEVQAGAQVLETQQTEISDQITGAQVTQLPITSRNAQDLAIMEPAMQTTGAPRDSTFNGLPPGALNITFDGINSQDNLLKSTTGSSFFSTEQPRLDDVQEFNITSSANDASNNGEGTVQIAMVSNKGGNQFHGGGWEYVRNDDLNANYYFSNIANQPRQRLRLNEFGYKLGGPMLKNKLFFFTDLDDYENPQGILRTRSIATPSEAAGSWTYPVTASAYPGVVANLASTPWITCQADNPVSGAPSCTVNTIQMMAAAKNSNGATYGGNNTLDPFEKNLVNSVAGIGSVAGVTPVATTSLNNLSYSFNNNAASHRVYPDVRLDYNISKNHSLEFDYHFAHYYDFPDILNSVDATFPIAPYNTNIGGQISDRNLAALAWRWQIAPTMNNELRVGFNIAPTWFSADQTLAVYPQLSQASLGTLWFNTTVPSGMTNPLASFGPSSRDTALGQMNETLSWLKGNHSVSFGASYTMLDYKADNGGEQQGTVNLGLSLSGTSPDPAAAFFTSANIPGAASADLSNAASLWGTMTGDVTGSSQSVFLNVQTHQYQADIDELEHLTENELGLFATDNWRVRPTLTFNYGLRWEWEGVPTDLYSMFYGPSNGQATLYGVSGVGNNFAPGVLQGAPPELVPSSTGFYSSYKKAFAPSLGLAWTPAIHDSFLNKIFGASGSSVFRAGYSLAYDREGLNSYLSGVPANTGASNSVVTSAVQATSISTTQGGFLLGSQNLSNDIAHGLSSAAFSNPNQWGTPIYPTAANGYSVDGYDPGLRAPLIESWQAGWQRQLDRNTAIEADYVGNHAMGLFVNENLNENNIFENGFLSEFENAQNNLAICQANATACHTAGAPTTGNDFADLGLTGQVALPILTASFTGSKTGAQTSSSFTNSTLVADLEEGAAGSMGSSLASVTSYGSGGVRNIVTAGYPVNFWTVNPNAARATETTNLGQSTYNALQLQLRRRMRNGLQFNVNYTYAHALQSDIRTYQNEAGKEPAPSDLRHVFKIENLYELPFGQGRRWKTGVGFFDNVLGGWEWDGITRWQSGDEFGLTGGIDTANTSDGGVQIVNTGVNQYNNVDSIQSQLSVQKLTNASGQGIVNYAPSTLLAQAGQPTGPGGTVIYANSNVLLPCSTPGKFCIQPWVYGPAFFRADWGLVKNTQITEKVKMTIRANVLDAFNNVNFLAPSGNDTGGGTTQSIQSTSFMRITGGYQDFTSTQDNGGRTIEIQARITF